MVKRLRHPYVCALLGATLSFVGVVTLLQRASADLGPPCNCSYGGQSSHGYCGYLHENGNGDMVCSAYVYPSAYWCQVECLDQNNLPANCRYVCTNTEPPGG
jgi:hypothetical protein